MERESCCWAAQQVEKYWREFLTCVFGNAYLVQRTRLNWTKRHRKDDLQQIEGRKEKFDAISALQRRMFTACVRECACVDKTFVFVAEICVVIDSVERRAIKISYWAIQKSEAPDVVKLRAQEICQVNEV